MVLVKDGNSSGEWLAFPIFSKQDGMPIVTVSYVLAVLGQN